MYQKNIPVLRRATLALSLSLALLLASTVASPMISVVKSAEAATSYTLTVRSLDLSGSTITGMYTVIRSSGGSILKTGFTPLTFTGDGGSSYSVTVSDYGQRTFDHWGDGSTSRTRTITLNQDMTANAYFKTGSTTTTQYALTVRSVDLSGSTITGLYTTIRSSSGTTLRTGYTPLTYTGTSGATYSVTISDYDDSIFDHWNNGSTARTRTITLSQATTITAYFETSTTAVANPVLTVRSVDLSGNTITGMYTTIKSSSGSTLKTGFTPTTYIGNGGSSYSITVSDYGGRTFDHWENGATSRTRTMTLSKDTTITAYFKTGTTSTTTTGGATGVYIPLYMYPGGTGWTHWQKVIDTKNAHPSVPFTAAINPNSGAGSSQNSAFVNGINKLQAANIRVLGYMSANYGDRSLDSLKAEIDKYISWYDVDGIMVDEFSNQAADLDYFKSLYTYAKSKGLYVKANPGTDIPESYVGTADNFSITEGSGYFDLSRLQGWHTKYEKSKWSFTRYATSYLDTEFVKDAAPYVGMMYITNGVSPERYMYVPSYFGTMVTTLDNLY